VSDPTPPQPEPNALDDAMQVVLDAVRAERIDADDARTLIRRLGVVEAARQVSGQPSGS